MLETAPVAVPARPVLGPVHTWLRPPFGRTRNLLEFIVSMSKLTFPTVRTNSHLHIRSTQFGLVKLGIGGALVLAASMLVLLGVPAIAGLGRMGLGDTLLQAENVIVQLRKRRSSGMVVAGKLQVFLGQFGEYHVVLEQIVGKKRHSVVKRGIAGHRSQKVT